MSTTADTLNVFILNKGPGKATMNLLTEGLSYTTVHLRSQLSGNGPNDTSPTFAKELPTNISNFTITVPDASISVVSYSNHATSALQHIRSVSTVSFPTEVDIQYYSTMGRRIGATEVNSPNFCGVYIVRFSNGRAELHTILTADKRLARYRKD